MSEGPMLSTKSASSPITPSIGMGASVRIGSDRYPYTVVKVSPSGKTIVLQADNYTRTDSNGLSESQEYSYAPNTEGAMITFRLGKSGYYKSKEGLYASIGYRRAYCDPCY